MNNKHNRKPASRPSPAHGHGEKPKDLLGTWKKIISRCGKYRTLIIIAVTASAVGTILMLLGPAMLSVLAGIIESGLSSGVDMDRVFNIGMILVGLYALSWVLSVAQQAIMNEVTQYFARGLRESISKKINRLPMWYYNTTSTGDVLSRVTNDVDTMASSIAQNIGTLVSSVTLFAGSIIMMLITDVIMTVVAILSVVVGFVIMGAIMGTSQKFFFMQQKALGDVNGHIEEIYSGHTIVRAYNAEEKSTEEFNRLNTRLRRSGFIAQCFGGIMHPLMGFVGNFGYVAVCVAGALLTFSGRIGFEVIVAFMMYVRFFNQPISQFAQVAQSMQSAAAAGERVFEFLENEEMEDESYKIAVIEDTRGEVVFDHVRFGYEDSDRIVINDFSAAAKPGQKIAIVGPTGAGKTTLVNLLMRFHELQGGSIKIDGVPISQLTRENVHDQFCMVLQDTWVFDGTIRENLVYCSENVSEEKMIEACKAVGLHHYIRTLPDGYDTVLDDTSGLSQGQKQQLTIARAMIADRPMLILDEATSSVDTRTELQIQRAMDELMRERTSFVIAHRLSTIKNADLILVLKDGDIVESGTHTALLEKGGFYAELYNSQFEDEAE